MSAEGLFEADLAALLDRLSSQLAEIHGLGRQVEDAIGELIRQSGQTGRASISSFQQLDVLVQSLDSLAVYVESLATAVPEGTLVDPREAIKGVKLRALSHALMSREHPGAETEPEDLHLF
jgi:hypothetical protein